MGVRAHGDDGVTENADVGAGTDTLDGVGGIGLPCVVVRHQGGGEVPSRR